jgi:hypothetical protein
MPGLELLRACYIAASSRVVLLDAGTEQTWLEALKQALRQSLGPPLKAFHAPIDEWLGRLPMSVAMVCAVGLYVVALVWVWGLRREFVFRGAPDDQWWRDLRIWATAVVIPYIAIYLLLGR